MFGPTPRDPPADDRHGLPALAAGRRRRWLAALVAAGLLRSAVAVAMVIVLRAFVDRHTVGEPIAVAAAAALVGALMLAVALTALLRWRETVDAEALAQHYIAHVRLRLFDRLAGLTPAEAQRRSRGGVLLRFVGDAQALRAWAGQGVARMASALAMLLVLLGALAWMAPAAAAAVGVGWALLAAIGWRGLPALRGATADGRRRQAQVAANVHDKIAMLPVWQLAQRRRLERERLAHQNRRLRRVLQRRADLRGRLRALVQLAAGGTGVIVLGHALWTLAGGIGSGGSGLGSALAAAALGGLMATPLRAVGRAVEAWAGAQVARERVLEFLGHAPAGVAWPERADQADAVAAADEGDAANAAHRATLDGEPSAAGLVASPDAAGVVAASPAGRPRRRRALRLQGVSVHGRLGPLHAEVRRGRRVALVGAHGSGKSTLLALAAGLLAPDAGAVWLDGEPLAALSAGQRRRRVALVAPELGLLRGTVAANLRYQDPDAPPAAIADALCLSGLDHLVGAWPDALATPVRDAGANLSQGARRALQLARALAGRPALLLIDDAQATLPGDPATTLMALIEAFPGTLVYACADPTLAALADEVWRLDAGRRVQRWRRPDPPATVGAAAAPPATVTTDTTAQPAPLH